MPTGSASHSRTIQSVGFVIHRDAVRDFVGDRETVLKLTDVSHSYAGCGVLKRLSFSLQAGEYCVVLGRSGGGKSTLLRLIAGLLQPDSGTIEIHGHCVQRTLPRHRDLALMFQDDHLYPHWTIRRTLTLACQQGPAPARSLDDLDAIVDRFGIAEVLDRRPDQVSGGQLRRAALAKAILRRPAIMLLDEPLHGLDASMREDLLTWIGQLPRQRGRSVQGESLSETAFLHVTHDGEEAMRLADRVAVLDQGAIDQSGSPSEIYHRPRTIAVARSLGSPSVNVLSAPFCDAMPDHLQQALMRMKSDPNSDGNWIVRPESIQINLDINADTDGWLDWQAEFQRACFVNGRWLSRWRSHGQDWSVVSIDDPQSSVVSDSATLSIRLHTVRWVITSIRTECR